MDRFAALFPARGSPAAERWACTSGPAGRETAALRPGAAAGCGGSVRNRKFRMQNSRFKIKRDSRAYLGLCSDSGRSLRRPRMTARSCGPSRGEAAARCGSFPEPQIQHSIFKIKRDSRPYLGIYSDSGRSLRRLRTTARSCGPPPPPGCGPLGLFKAETQNELQPSIRCAIEFTG